ncbi:hypothetical protein NDU88_001280 [Pleurodeles waltl]|uniref:Uncharacterized protein n=1 Tax=Pleurodeles waltl TaxID=8319 RepID=A0AAV7ML27_PLEWA|nr:hypothetical protein NDU88_001280 [Pleurodeles waltl]
MWEGAVWLLQGQGNPGPTGGRPREHRRGGRKEIQESKKFCWPNISTFILEKEERSNITKTLHGISPSNIEDPSHTRNSDFQWLKRRRSWGVPHPVERCCSGF